MILFQCDSKLQSTQNDHKIDLLILSGSNNHDWEATTAQLERMYTQSRRFKTSITESPDTLKYEDFEKFHVIVSNWNAWPENKGRWPGAAETGLMKFIEEGGGLVLFHAASAAFYDWADFQKIIGTTWGDSTRHGRISPHKIVIKDQGHPITNGIEDFWITDELWVNAGINNKLNMLAEAYSEPANQGRSLMEPVVHWNTKGKGRIFHNILGHDVRAMKNTGWQALMLRGTEWAATGKVTIPVPYSLQVNNPAKSMEFSWMESDTSLALMSKDLVLWQYNFNTQKGKPFFHPVNIGNSSVTWLSPDDHPWHLGIWHSWKYINGVNYWEYERAEGVPPWNFQGITEIRAIDFEKNEDFSCNIFLDVAYHEKNSPDLMIEKRTIKVSSPDNNGVFLIDYLFEFTAHVDKVELNRTPLEGEENGQSWGGYAGLSLRFGQDFFEPVFINPDGTENMNHGGSMKWKFYGLRDIQGNKLGVAIFDHPDNLNHPTPWFVTNNEDHPFYYFSPAPIFYEPHMMKRDEKLKLNYRMQFYSSEVKLEDLSQDYSNFLQKEK